MAEPFNFAQYDAASARKCRYPAVLYAGVDLGQVPFWPNSEVGAVVVGARRGLEEMMLAEPIPVTANATEIVRGDVPGGPSTSQTIMVSSLRRLLALLPTDASADAYRSAVMQENILGKRTGSGREWAFRQLRRFYALDNSSLLFRALRDLWVDEPSGQPLLAMLCALARDPVLRASTSVILGAEPGEVVGPANFDSAIEAAFPGAYKDNTRRTTAQKVASSWSQSGHLHAEKPARKVRAQVHPTPAAVTYALLLGYIQGGRGQALFETVWIQVLDQPKSHLVDLAASAAKRGMLEFRHAGGAMEVTFHQLLRPFDGNQEELQ